MKINSGHLHKLEVLAATGMPGAYKVLIFFLIQKIHGLSVLGNIASWQSIAQILGFFTAIGWSSLVLVRVAKAKTNKDRVEVFNSLMVMGALTLLLGIASMVFVGVLLGEAEHAVQISYWLAAWTLYQIPRHYLIAVRSYRYTLCLDAAVIGFSICSLAVATAEYASIWLALSMLVSGVVTFCFIQKGANATPPVISYEIKGLEFGLVNFLSGGIFLSLIPLASYFESEVFAGALSMFVSIAGIALLIPRAISLNQLPQLAKVIKDPKAFASRVVLMRKKINQSNVFASVVCLFVGIVLLSQLPENLTTNQLAPVFFLIIVQNALGILGLVDANILMAIEESRFLLKVGVVVSIVFFMVVALMILMSVGSAFLYLCLVLTLLTTYRLFKNRYYVKKNYDSHTAI